MSVPILYHGEDSKTLVDTMRKEAMQILSVEDESTLLRHGDYQEVSPISKSYLFTMKQIQSVIEESSLPPFKGKKRVIALLFVDRMLPVHANALLKTLEDAPSFFQLMLVTTKCNDILKTILSRVQKYHVEGSAALQDHKEKIEEIIHLLREGKYASFLKSIEEIDKGISEDASEVEMKLRHFLESFAAAYTNELPKGHLMSSSVVKLEQMITSALRGFNSNIKIKHVLENLFLESQQLNHNS